MPLSKGSQLGPYEILDAIGAGGMGEVYRARDARLGRDVAIKVLPETFARDVEKLSRFQREAKMLAALNHPNIASIYGFEDSGNVHALVMELVEGPTLADRIARGAIPVEEALPIAKQIAEGVEYAHERGIVHRDLKPANIKIAGNDAVKILDFGLAKAMDADASQGDMSNSPTLTHMATQAGIILGTAAYMSPEQAKGRVVDRRTDIWAFGCVLYEMLTGKMAFSGESITETLAAVIREEPDWSLLPADTPSAIRHLLARCLKKDARQRLQSIGDARIAIEEVLSGAPGDSHAFAAAAAGVRASLWRRTVPWVVAAIATLAAIAFAFFQPASPGPPLRKFEIDVENLAANWVSHPEISPDGRIIAYVAGNDLFVRELDQLGERKLYSVAPNRLGTPVFWSPDSESIGFEDQGRLWRISVTGGSPTEICTVPDFILGAAWDANGEIFFSVWRGDMYEVSAQGGDAKALGLVNRGTEVDFHELSLLQGDLDLIYPVHQVTGGGGVEVLTNGRRKTVFEQKGWVPATPVYSPSGEILFENGGSQSDTTEGIWAVPFSLAKLEVTGQPFLVNGKGTAPSVSSDGTLIYEMPASPRQSQMVWVGRDGKIQGVIGQPQPGLAIPALSPDGKRIAVAAREENGDENIWVYDVTRGVRTQLLTSPAGGFYSTPTWTPDGDRIVFSSSKNITYTLFVIAADGSGETHELLQGIWPQVSARGDYLAYTIGRKAGPGFAGASRDVCYASIGGGTLPTPIGKTVCLPNTSGDDFGLRISPDERYAAYTAEEAGQSQVYITRFPSGEGRWQVSANGGGAPVWSSRGDELYFIADNNLMAVKVTTQPSLHLGTPVELFSLESDHLAVAQDSGGSMYDVSPNGQRFLMVQQLGEEPPRTIVVDQNWFAEFAKRRRN
ncbi:MAG: protein kinase [Candidatus Acidiferrales bacterium]